MTAEPCPNCYRGFPCEEHPTNAYPHDAHTVERRPNGTDYCHTCAEPIAPDHDCEPTDDGTACRHCGQPAQRADMTPDAFVLLATHRGTADDHTWSWLLGYADGRRREAIRAAQLTPDELATAAARFGIVADGAALPFSACRPAAVDAIQTGRPGNDLGLYARWIEADERQREAADVWAGWRRARYGTSPGWHDQPAYYESADAFEEREMLAGRVPPGRDMSAMDVAAMTRYHRRGADPHGA